MKIKVGYTTYVEVEMKVDDKFAPLMEDETEDNWRERDKLCDEMLSIVGPQVGARPNYIGVLTEDEEICIFEI